MIYYKLPGSTRGRIFKNEEEKKIGDGAGEKNEKREVEKDLLSSQACKHEISTFFVRYSLQAAL